MTVQTARNLKSGTMVYHVTKKNADGSPMRAKVTSVKAWKTRPDMVELHVKHGMYDYAVFTENDLDQLTTDDEPSGNGVSGHWALTKDQFEGQRL